MTAGRAASGLRFGRPGGPSLPTASSGLVAVSSCAHSKTQWVHRIDGAAGFNYTWRINWPFHNLVHFFCQPRQPMSP